MKESLFLFVILAGALLPAVSTREVTVSHPSIFEAKAFSVLVPASYPDNAVFSPAGLAICFGCLGDGIGGTRHADIAQELGVTTDFASKFHQITHHYANLNDSNIVAFANANSFWSRDCSRIELDFMRIVQRDFGGEVGQLSTIRPINAWTAAMTDGMIPEVVTNIMNSAVVALVSATAFHGIWARPFPQAATRPRPFTPAQGDPILLPTMSELRTLAIIRRPGYRVTRLNYRGGSVSLWVLLPNAGRTLADLRNALTAEAIDGIARSFEATNDPDVVRGPVDFSMPKFRLETAYDLMDAFKAFKIPLSGYAHIGADFEIGQAVHRAVIVVDETGPNQPPRPSTAPAADDVSSGRTPFACNRPFLFLVRDEDLDLTLLAGQFTGCD